MSQNISVTWNLLGVSVKFTFLALPIFCYYGKFQTFTKIEEYKWTPYSHHGGFNNGQLMVNFVSSIYSTPPPMSSSDFVMLTATGFYCLDPRFH